MSNSYADPRYSAGSALEATDKERAIDDIDEWLGISDELFVALKKLTLVQLRELKDVVAASIKAARAKS